MNEKSELEESMGKVEKETVRTLCSICMALCGIEVTVENGKVVKVEGDKQNPISQGYICPKARAVGELVEVSNRYKNPLKKDQNGDFQEIEWEEAVDYLANKLADLKEKHGPEAVAFHAGQSGVNKEFWPMLGRFAGAFGSPNFSTAGALCHVSKIMANFHTIGSVPSPDYENSRCIFLWGFNPQKTTPPANIDINHGISKGAKLIVVDPIATSTAKKADIHLQLRPGSDGALALGILNIIIAEDLFDHDFVEKWTVGFDMLRELTFKYTPENVEASTWVPAQKIIEAARLYANTRPAILYAGNAIELQSNGFQALRAINILQAVCGDLDIKGGARFTRYSALAHMRIPHNSDKEPIGMKEFPLFCQGYHQAQSNLYTQAILEGAPYPLKAMLIMGANPMLTWPNVSRMKEALEKLEFLAVTDNYLTPTAELADLFIPAPTFLSRHELWNAPSSNGDQYIGLGPKVVDDNRPTDWQIVKQLAERMGYDDHFPWGSYEEWMDDRLKPLKTTVEELKELPEGKVYARYEERKYEKAGFRTPSGKVELYSEKLESLGYDPLPIYREPDESPFSKPELAEEYPLVITTGKRTFHYMHSRHRELPSLKKASPEPFLEMHPDKGAELGVADGDEVVVESKRGDLSVKVAFNDGIDPRVISMVHGWWEANANLLTDDTALDPITGFPPYRAFLARVIKKG